MATRINKQQRVGVFVDVQNMYYSAKNLYKAKVNFKALLQEAVKGRNLIRAIAYVIEAQELKEKTFFDALSNIGFEIKAKELQMEMILSNGVKGLYNPAITCFMMKNMFRWRDVLPDEKPEIYASNVYQVTQIFQSLNRENRDEIVRGKDPLQVIFGQTNGDDPRSIQTTS